MSTYKDLFTPIFIVVALALFIGGIVILQVLDKLFHGSEHLSMIRIFCISIILNVIIIVFLLVALNYKLDHRDQLVIKVKEEIVAKLQEYKNVLKNIKQFKKRKHL